MSKPPPIDSPHVEVHIRKVEGGYRGWMKGFWQIRIVDNRTAYLPLEGEQGRGEISVLQPLRQIRDKMRAQGNRNAGSRSGEFPDVCYQPRDWTGRTKADHDRLCGLRGNPAIGHWAFDKQHAHGRVMDIFRTTWPNWGPAGGDRRGVMTTGEERPQLMRTKVCYRGPRQDVDELAADLSNARVVSGVDRKLLQTCSSTGKAKPPVNMKDSGVWMGPGMPLRSEVGLAGLGAASRDAARTGK